MKPEILTNLEQIQYLQWIGESQSNCKKLGKWTAAWRGEKIIDVGGLYLENGKKQGFWKEIIQNFQKEAQVFQQGEYIHEQRKGTWKYIYKNKEIGGGEYNQLGEKNGKWLELWAGFWEQSQVFYCGEYQNGKKVGVWDIFYNFDGKNIKIGGGCYDNLRNGIKFGNWVEISNGFYYDSQVTYNGTYKKGKKLGQWDISYANKKIGGGYYDEVGDETKVGQWVEISDGFFGSSQVTFTGEYKSGKKIGKWDTWFEYIGNEIIGGGCYSDAGDGIKFGNWVEISEGFYLDSKVTYIGQYKNGKKFSRWDIWYKKNYGDQKNEMIGGGYYDDEGCGIKLGNWVEISEEFFSSSQVKHSGVYKNDKKIGSWDILYRENYGDYNQKIGGGCYDEVGDGIKQGHWVEISDRFSLDSQVTYVGEYQNGKKIGRWDTWYKKNYGDYNNNKIGGGYYDEGGHGIKLGNWVEISDGFNRLSQIMQNGEYKNGKKVGRWDIFYKKNFGDYNEKIGGGCYDEIGDGIKQGYWMEISDRFYLDSQVTYVGEYKNGKKISRWDIFYQEKSGNNTKMQQYILVFIFICKFSGGGYFDDKGDGTKQGYWVEIPDSFDHNSQITFNGQYKNDKKVGLWVEMKKNQRKNFKKIKEMKYDI
ncbi:unnamed protein product [Paramecium pentaurelia]|uniref:Uncharacterized protein n=1 Tax=Paramecium pentaurelia TaxID=43138 RepID=A0A8S1TEE6_9CILI|nr:unnamed protein product [Paramecium pentaurelia]